MSTDLPAAVDSEQALLGACMQSGEVYGRVTRLISDDDWYRPWHADVWRLMRKLTESGQEIDARVVGIELARERPALSGHVAELATSWVPSGTVEYHAERVVNAAVARHLLEELTRAAQRAEDAEWSDAVGVAEQTIEALRLVQQSSVATAAVSTRVDVLDLIEREDSPDDWIVDGMLAREERLMLTAPEGYGKSSLLRQIGLCVAAGLHPFYPEGIAPRRVLVWDAENPEKINRAEYRKITSMLEYIGQMPKYGMLTIEQVGPCNLLDARQAAKLYATVDDVRPDLIIIGPIYQLHEENPNDEGPARKLSAVLDRARLMHGSALITEAHTPHSDGPHGQLLRPYGASLWKRWPEFGYCLHPAPDSDQRAAGEAGHIARQLRESVLTPWRGARGAGRTWPMYLHAGARLPWEST